MSPRPTPDYFLILEAAAAAFTAWRLLQFHLARRFPFFVFYLVVVIVGSFAFGMISDLSQAYMEIFLVLEPFLWVAAALSVFELFTTLFRDYPGIRTIGRWSLYAALGISIAISIYVTTAAEKAGAGVHRARFSLHTFWVLYALILDRSIHFALALIIIVLMLCLSRYPLNLDRNSRVSSSFFSAIFLSQAAASLMDSVSPLLYIHTLDNLQVVFSAICLITWGGMLAPATQAPKTHKAVDPEKEAQLLQQLEAMNQLLVRVGRK